MAGTFDSENSEQCRNVAISRRERKATEHRKQSFIVNTTVVDHPITRYFFLLQNVL